MKCLKLEHEKKEGVTGGRLLVSPLYAYQAIKEAKIVTKDSISKKGFSINHKGRDHLRAHFAV
jgi:hypothetical protein